jgi:gamma-glutamylcyclotransferase (GGCT)/AIG2-like uncharacterized protein YtfP
VVKGDLFVYGSLLLPDVLLALLGRVPGNRPASAAGWRPARLLGRTYPGLTPAPGVTAGVVLTDLSKEDWHRIDAFEDETYELKRVTLMDGRDAWAYVWLESATTSEENWDLDKFVRMELSGYVERCKAWAAKHA